MVTRSSMPSLEEYIEEIKPIFDSCYLTNMGPMHNTLQQQLEQYLNVPEVSLFGNGHMALEIAIQALGLHKSEGEVITTPFTFVSTTHAIVRNGLKPVFCDIKADDYTLNPSLIEELITENTVAILPVHVYGNVCDVEAIESIARKHHLKVIYDAAHAFGVNYKGVGIGNYGDASMFSFHATKVFHTIEGGAITYKDTIYTEKLNELKNFGIHGEGVTEVGANAKMDEFRAAMGVCNLRHIDESIQKRGKVVALYRERLGSCLGIQLCQPRIDVKSNNAYFPVYFDELIFGKSRDMVIEQLKAQDVFARRYFYPAVNEMECYSHQFPQNTPVAHDVSTHILTLPLYEGLQEDDVNRICDIVLS